MATISSISTGTSTQISSDISGEDHLFEKDVIYWSTDFDPTIRLTASNYEVQIESVVAGAGNAIQFGADIEMDLGHKLIVTSTGSLLGGTTAVVIWGCAMVVNAGEIRGDEDSLEIALGDTTSSRITNSGLMSGGVYGMDALGSTDARIQVTNSGHIKGGKLSYLGGGAVEKVPRL